MAKATLSTERIRELAREGAARALGQLKAEIVAIERTFPELASRGSRRVKQSVAKTRKRTHKMSAAARKEVSRRMKKYWAQRRKAKAA